MTTTIDRIHEEIKILKKDIEFIKHAVGEEFELSDEAKKALEKARRTPENKYVEI